MGAPASTGGEEIGGRPCNGFWRFLFVLISAGIEKEMGFEGLFGAGCCLQVVLGRAGQECWL